MDVTVNRISIASSIVQSHVLMVFHGESQPDVGVDLCVFNGTVLCSVTWQDQIIHLHTALCYLGDSSRIVLPECLPIGIQSRILSELDQLVAEFMEYRSDLDCNDESNYEIAEQPSRMSYGLARMIDSCLRLVGVIR